MKKLSLIDNSLDSLEVGIRFYIEDNTKHAILNVFHSIELLLKERVARECNILIFRDNHKRLIDQKSQTVGFDEILVLFKNLDIHLDDDKIKILRHLKDQRNDITHFEYTPNVSDKDNLGLALKFIKTFMDEHLNLQLEDQVEESLYQEIEEIVDSFEERYSRALKVAKDLVKPKTKDDLCDFRSISDCPECFTPTLVVVSGEGECTLCKEQFQVDQCSYCGEYSNDVDSGMLMCDYCREKIWSRDD